MNFFEPKNCPEDMVLVNLKPHPFCIDRYEASDSEKLKKADLNDDEDFNDFMGILSGKIYDSAEYSYEAAFAEESDFNDQKTSKTGTMQIILKETNIPLPQSAKDKDPWILVNRFETGAFCSASGKRLPTNFEWFKAAEGTPDYLERPKAGKEACNIFNGSFNDGKSGSVPNGSTLDDNDMAREAVKTGTSKDCVSKYGAYDMVGNVWEWVDEIATGDSNSNFKVKLKNNRNKMIDFTWPKQGYITSIDQSTGAPTSTDLNTIKKEFNLDYTYTFGNWDCSEEASDGYGCNKSTAKQRGIMRGGSAINGLPAGINRADLEDAPSISFTLLGFRCAKDAS